jgi:hypothetical protein
VLDHILAVSNGYEVTRRSVVRNQLSELAGITTVEGANRFGIGEDVADQGIVDPDTLSIAVDGDVVQSTNQVDESLGCRSIELEEGLQAPGIAAAWHSLDSDFPNLASLSRYLQPDLLPASRRSLHNLLRPLQAIRCRF